MKKEIKDIENIENNEPEIIIKGVNILSDKKEKQKNEDSKKSGIIFKKLIKTEENEPFEEIKIKPRKLKTKLFFGKHKLETIKESIINEKNDNFENKIEQKEKKEDIKEEPKLNIESEDIKKEKKILTDNKEIIEQIKEENPLEDSLNKENEKEKEKEKEEIKEENDGNTQKIEINKEQINEDEKIKKEEIQDNEENKT